MRRVSQMSSNVFDYELVNGFKLGTLLNKIPTFMKEIPQMSGPDSYFMLPGLNGNKLTD